MVNLFADKIRITFYAAFSSQHQTFQSAVNHIFHIAGYHFLILNALRLMSINFFYIFSYIWERFSDLVG